jgi:hypothetical protein
MSDSLSNSEIILYQTEDGRTRIQCWFENETIWLTQALIAELFEKDVRTINEHLLNIFDEGELRREATIRKFRIVRTEGKREVVARAAKAFAESEFEKYRIVQDRLFESDFDRMIKQLPNPEDLP